MQLSQQANTTRMAPAPPNATPDPPALLVLLPINGTFERKQINVPLYPEVLRIGRQTNAKTVPTPLNGYFDSKVLSRQHAEVWAERNGKIWIRDVKSSNGTFVNGQRLSPESRDSEPHELRENDILELGIKSIVHHKVSAKVEHAGIHQNPTSVLDLNIGDIDPGTNGGVLAPMYPQQMPVRGRGGSQGSVSNNGRVSIQSMPPNLNGMMPRHMNAWMAPISIEQVVKRLGVRVP
jgi:pSer/pThr/pTyr-binding forkhead associated (FHA) protein